jgi:hypothetical protein
MLFFFDEFPAICIIHDHPPLWHPFIFLAIGFQFPFKNQLNFFLSKISFVWMLRTKFTIIRNTDPSLLSVNKEIQSRNRKSPPLEVQVYSLQATSKIPCLRRIWWSCLALLMIKNSKKHPNEVDERKKKPASFALAIWEKWMIKGSHPMSIYTSQREGNLL